VTEITGDGFVHNTLPGIKAVSIGSRRPITVPSHATDGDFLELLFWVTPPCSGSPAFSVDVALPSCWESNLYLDALVDSVRRCRDLHVVSGVMFHTPCKSINDLAGLFKFDLAEVAAFLRTHDVDPLSS
jgi:hypothetical protein